MNFMQSNKWYLIAERLEKGESLQNAVNEVLAERPPLPASRKSRIEITMPKLKDDMNEIDLSLLSPAEQRTIQKLERRYEELEYELKSHVKQTIKEYEERLDQEYILKLKKLDEEYALKLKGIGGL